MDTTTGGSVGLQTIVLERSGETFPEPGKPGVIGKRGTLTVAGQSYFTVERGGNYVTLPNGTFECSMENDATRGRLFFVFADGEHGHGVTKQGGGYAGILIHAANRPSALLGCVAPGKTKETYGVSQSRAALDEIFILLGGFKVGSKCLLEVK